MFPPTRKRSHSDPYRQQTHNLDANRNKTTMAPFHSPQFLPVPVSPAFLPYHGQWVYPSPPFFPTEVMYDEPEEKDSEKPDLHPLLRPVYHNTNGLHSLYDVRYKVDKTYISVTHPVPRTNKMTEAEGEYDAVVPRVPKMRIVCKNLPWPIVVKNPTGVTIRDVLEALHTELQKPFTEGEWWIAQDEDRKRVSDAWERGCAANSGLKRKKEDGLKRVDWLGDHTLFAGLSRTSRGDEELIKKRCQDPKVQAECWVLIMHKSPA
ncbi:hypothetical protein FRC03_003207 [Tulasnella sp. 419]|nr:hypothetical protein FRC03_003207 [Tulasnella sp. 419]